MRVKQIALATLFAASMALPALAQPATAPVRPTPATPVLPATVAPSASTPATALPATPAKPGTATTAGTASKSTKSTTAIVNINTATATELQTVKGIGKSHAAAIIKGRPYKSVDEIDSKKVLPHTEYEKMKAQFSI